MHRRSPILEKLADLYAASPLGETGTGRFTKRFEELIVLAGCDRGEPYANAIGDLHEGERLEMLSLQCSKSGDIQLVRVPLEREAALFGTLGRVSPSQEREAWARLFESAAGWAVPIAHEQTWRAFCEQRARQARAGTHWRPFRRGQRARAARHLEITARLLAWTHPALLRTVSVQIAESSKFLERSRGTLLALLAEATAGSIATFEHLQISDNPRQVPFHGPVRVTHAGGVLDFTDNPGSSTLSEDTLASAQVEVFAPRCVTVENATKFHELCRLGCGDLFVHTSYPNRATLDFLRRLPPSIPIFHFGDTDPWGFDVLGTLRRSLDRPVLPLHMHYRPRDRATPLTPRDLKKLRAALADPILADVREELLRIEAAGTKGDFEQEGLLVGGPFPYLAPA